MLYYYNIFLLLVQEISCYCCVLNNQSTQEKLFVSSVRWHFFVFRNSVEKLCVSWALLFVECVAVWALKLPVVSAPLRSLHNRSPPDFLQLIPTYSKPTRHKVFLRNYWNTKEPAANICHKPILPNSVFLYLINAFRNAFLDAVAATSINGT